AVIEGVVERCFEDCQNAVGGSLPAPHCLWVIAVEVAVPLSTAWFGPCPRRRLGECPVPFANLLGSQIRTLSGTQCWIDMGDRATSGIHNVPPVGLLSFEIELNGLLHCQWPGASGLGSFHRLDQILSLSKAQHANAIGVGIVVGNDQGA